MLDRAQGRETTVVFLFALLLHAVGIGGDYVLDDTRAVLGHPAVIGEVPIWEVFTREFWGRPLEAGWSSSWRPLTSLSLAIEHRITPDAWLHHLVNVFAFAGLCAMVTRTIRKAGDGAAALLIGLIFAALPIHVESVASIVGRGDVLASLLCLVAFDRIRSSTSAPAIGLAAGLYLAALLCKESVALFPGIVLWLQFLAWRRTESKTWKIFAPGIAMAATGLAYLVLRQNILPVGLPTEFVAADNQLTTLSGIDRVWGNLAVLGHYAEITVVPLRLCADHTYGDVVTPIGFFERNALWAWLGLGLVVLMVRDGVKARRDESSGMLFATGLAYLLIGHWVIDLSVILAERIAMWPTVWLALAAAGLAERLGEGPRRVGLWLFLLVGALGFRTVDRTLDWRDSVQLYESSARACPAAVHNRFNLGDAMRKAGRPADAVWHFGMAGAGRHAFPGEFDVEAFDVEWTEPVERRLPRLPELVGEPDARAFWAGLHRFFVQEQSKAEADLVAHIASKL